VLAVGRGDVTVVSPDGAGTGVRSVAIMKLPAAVWRRVQLKAGNTIAFAATLLTHGQAYRVEWAGNFTLAE
jgi:hypothetical protein